MKEKILKIIENKPKHFSKMVKTRPELMNWVESNTQVSTENLSEKIYSALYSCTNECKYGNKKKFNSINEGYRFCGPSGKCACAAESVSEKVSLVKSNYSESRRKEIAETRKQTVIERYGVTNSGQTTFAKKKHKEYYDHLERKPKPKKLTSFQRLNLKFKKLSNVEFVTDESNYKGVSNQAYYRFKCNKCENIFDDYIDNGHLPKCDICHPYIPTYTSKQETEVYEYIKTITNKVVKQTDKSLINPYFNKKYQTELLRFCSESTLTVVGGLSKLMSYAKKQVSGAIITYCDASKSQAQGYIKAGFVLQHLTDPGYFWTDGAGVISRYKCQKQNLKKWLSTYNPETSESENMFAAGYRRYWDCGNYVLIY